jgi:glutamate N-acetyltransferase/amino-acid N-acetyltransferase
MPNETINAPKGFRCAAVACGIKPKRALDLGVLVADAPYAAAATFTSNRFCGAPVVVGREHARDGRLQAIIVNSGTSNVAMGQQGIDDARATCAAAGRELHIDPALVLPSSTGVIGHPLPMAKVRRGIRQACAALSTGSKAGADFARAMMTTDTRPKQACIRLPRWGATVTVAGAAKGSGMIAPNMATMLAFLTTDAAVEPLTLQRLLRNAVEETFNRITVDECQSTSDTVAILASALSGAPLVRGVRSREGRWFADALRDVCKSLSDAIVCDGEGATRVIEVVVVRAKTPGDAHEVARAVAASPLVKTAIHGGDPNWGRIIQAIGTCKATYNPMRVIVRIGHRIIFAEGRGTSPHPTKFVQRYMKAKKRVMIHIDLCAGRYQDRVLTCDLSREYVRINADYTT